MVATTLTALIIINSVIFTSEAYRRFSANLHNGVSDYYIRPNSGISWVHSLYDPGPGSCNVRGTIRIPFSLGDFYIFRLYFNSNPSGFNFHINNGCGDGWGGTPGCYEINNYNTKLYVYGRTGSNYSTFLEHALSNEVIVTVKRGQLKFYRNNKLVKTASHPTLFKSSYIYFSMNRVYYLHPYPSSLRIGTGFCRVHIYKFP